MSSDDVPRVSSWWPGAPPVAGAVALVSVAALAYGTVVHVVQLAIGGLALYQDQPAWLAGFFLSLTLTDPTAAVLLWKHRRSGVILSCVVLVTDSFANGYANYVLSDVAGLSPGRIGQAVITLLAVALLVAAPWLWVARVSESIRSHEVTTSDHPKP